MAAVPTPRRWDIFCKVVDNFGDAGVCWRIARLLAQEQGLAVRLWIDRPETLRAMLPALDLAQPAQLVEGVELRDWSRLQPRPEDAQVVVEAFGCGLPDAYVGALASLPRQPLWIVLEYLTAESWIDGHHGLASPLPRLPLQRWYFFPGFTADSGGLPREHDLIERREAFGGRQRDALWADLGFVPPPADALTLSLFAYAGAPFAALLTALAAGPSPVVVAAASEPVIAAVRGFFGGGDAAGSLWRRGRLEVRALPFMPQRRYDELLWGCDLNFVRGEDSFVRAQWAARPMVWQPYRQDDGAHLKKLAAFMERHAEGLDPAAAAALGRFTAAWNGDGGADFGRHWPALRAALGDLRMHARRWAGKLADSGELSAKLVEFVRSRVK